MAYNAETSHSNTSLYYSYFQILFDTVDTTAYFWQPLMRAVGTSQMEIAGLQARQAQALMRWTHEIMRPAPSPMHHFNACAELWTMMIGNCAEVAPRVAAAGGSVAAPVVKLPVKRSRDRLVLLERDEQTGETYERKVA
ncbi:hypothetical protein DLM45_06325 [Hyphomicrobium methylovorum]|nr:hypothetical protein [Hyphomicrobium methylovorum]